QGLDPTFAVSLQSQPHAAPCRTSCPDCLRDYSNLPYHSVLDWRLGLDLARLALDLTAPIDFSVPYWNGVEVLAAQQYFAALPNWQQTTFGGLPAAYRGTLAEIITHPLWIDDLTNLAPQLAPAYTAAIAAGYRVRFKSLFEILR